MDNFHHFIIVEQKKKKEKRLYILKFAKFSYVINKNFIFNTKKYIFDELIYVFVMTRVQLIRS